MSNYLLGIRKGLTDAVSKASSVAKVAAEVAKDLAEEGLHGKTAKDYRLQQQVATCGPNDVWKIYSATSKRPGALFKDVSIWILDKRGLLEASKSTAKARVFDACFEQQRRSCSQMTRLKHPGVVKVIEPLEETSTQMILVTEPIMGSLKNIVTQFSGIPSVPDATRSVSLSQLETKLGLVHVTDTLTFLHTEATLAHCGLSPQVIMLTAEGAWKLAGFAFAVATDYAAPAANAPLYTYTDPFPPVWEDLAKPLLSYTAPELVGGWGGTAQASGSLTPASDVFSLAAIAYELFAGAQLLPVRSNVHEYRAKVTSLATADMSPCPSLLQAVLRSMLSPTAAARPAAAAFSASSFFQEDIMLRALRFLDTIMQRETTQKVAFVKDLAGFWSQLDDRLLRHKVVPPLIQEMRGEAMQVAALPVLLPMLERLGPGDFAGLFLPLLQPVLESAQGESLLLLVQHSAALGKLMSGAAMGSVLIPLLARALDSGPPKAQEEVIRHLLAMVDTLDYSLFKTAIMPRIHNTALRTTSAAVRAHALMLMARAVPRLDREEADKMVEVVVQVTSVDRTAPTVMCVVQLAEAISAQWGADVTAMRLLPLLCPLLIAPSLSPRQFSDFMTIVQAMLQRVQHKMTPDGGRHDSGTAMQASDAASNGPSWDTPLQASSRHRTNAAAPMGHAGTTTSAATATPSWMGPPPTTNHAKTPSWTTTIGPKAPAPVARGGSTGTSATAVGPNQSTVPTGHNTSSNAVDLFGGLSLNSTFSSAVQPTGLTPSWMSPPPASASGPNGVTTASKPPTATASGFSHTGSGAGMHGNHDNPFLGGSAGPAAAAAVDNPFLVAAAASSSSSSSNAGPSNPFLATPSSSARNDPFIASSGAAPSFAMRQQQQQSKQGPASSTWASSVAWQQLQQVDLLSAGNKLGIQSGPYAAPQPAAGITGMPLPADIFGMPSPAGPPAVAPKPSPSMGRSSSTATAGDQFSSLASMALNAPVVKQQQQQPAPLTSFVLPPPPSAASKAKPSIDDLLM